MSDDLFDDDGRAKPLRIELVQASGPVSPRFAYATTLVLEAGPDTPPRLVRDHRDAAGAHHDERLLARDAYEALVLRVLTALPLGTTLDLVADKRARKGISFNHVAVTLGSKAARLDYLLSDIDEEDGDPRARAIVHALDM